MGQDIRTGMRVTTSRGSGVVTSTEIIERMDRIWWIDLDDGRTVAATRYQIQVEEDR